MIHLDLLHVYGNPIQTIFLLALPITHCATFRCAQRDRVIISLKCSAMIIRYLNTSGNITHLTINIASIDNAPWTGERRMTFHSSDDGIASHRIGQKFDPNIEIKPILIKYSCDIHNEWILANTFITTKLISLQE